MSEAISGTALVSMQKVYEHSLKVMKRQQASYDYEKVFWNSVWSMGLVGLGWLSIQLMKFIKFSQDFLEDPVKTVTVVVTRGEYEFFKRWVEGEHADKEFNPWASLFWIKGHAQKQMIEYLRANPEEWAKVKEKYEGVDVAGGEGFIAVIDQTFGKILPYLPPLVVGGHVFLEYKRVKKIKKELKLVGEGWD